MKKQELWKLEPDGTTNTQSFNKWMYDDWQKTINKSNEDKKKLDNSNLNSEEIKKANDNNNQKTVTDFSKPSSSKKSL